ncbi:MAG: hypothetical protein WB709_08760 [Solirubrobacteraceae bacterium]
MSHLDSNRRKPTTTTAALTLALLLTCLGLAACGGSSSSTTSTSANASATAPKGASGAGATGPGGARFTAVRECLQKNGITLPQRPPGQRGSRPGGPSGFLGGNGADGPQLPSGVTRAQMQAALKKCGAGGGQFRRGARLKSPAYRAALTKFATCMRENGVNLPAPNTSGNGPIFSTKGLNTASAQFRSAELKCRSDLAAGTRRGL